jgi:hypothetical protein
MVVRALANKIIYKEKREVYSVHSLSVASRKKKKKKWKVKPEQQKLLSKKEIN